MVGMSDAFAAGGISSRVGSSARSHGLASLSTRKNEGGAFVPGLLLQQMGPLPPMARGGSRGGVLGTHCAASAAQIREKLSFYNTLTRDKQPFKPEQEGKVKMYTCGPTVYDFAHIGNFRAFLTYDLIKRWLLYCGYDVDHVCNLTDIDDKIIQRMKRDNISLKDLTNKYAGRCTPHLHALPCITHPRTHATDLELLRARQTHSSAT